MVNKVLKMIFSSLSILIPTNPRIWICGSWYGNKYGDNPKYLHKYLNENNLNVKCYWVTKNIDVYNSIKAKNGLVLLYGSAQFYLIMIRAKVHLCNCQHDKDTFSMYSNWKSIYINLWHGSPMKKIGLDAIDNNTVRTNKSKLFKREIFFVSPSDYVTNVYKSAFDLSDKNIIRNNYCKLDYAFHKSKNKNKNKILYAPTYRGEYNSEISSFEQFGLSIIKINQCCIQLDCLFVVRLHPANYLSNELKSHVAKLSNIYIDETEDVYEHLSEYKLMITDFSSIFFDGLALNIPSYLSLSGSDDYIKNERQLYINPYDVFDGYILNDWNSLKDLISNASVIDNDLSYYYDNSTVNICSDLISKINEII